MKYVISALVGFLVGWGLGTATGYGTEALGAPFTVSLIATVVVAFVAAYAVTTFMLEVLDA